MASNLETFNLPHFPSLPVHAALYRDVQNASFLKAQLLAGQSEYEYAFIDASMVCRAYFSPGHEIKSPALNLHTQVCC